MGIVWGATTGAALAVLLKITTGYLAFGIVIGVLWGVSFAIGFVRTRGWR